MFGNRWVFELAVVADETRRPTSTAQAAGGLCSSTHNIAPCVVAFLATFGLFSDPTPHTSYKNAPGNWLGDTLPEVGAIFRQLHRDSWPRRWERGNVRVILSYGGR